MNRRRESHAVITLIALIAVACAEHGPTSADLDRAIAEELDRLEALAAAIDPDPLPEPLRRRPAEERARITAVRETDSPELRLYRLREAFVGAETLAFIAAHPKEATDLGALERLWNTRREAFGREDPESPGPLLARALAETARNRAEKLYRASLPYGRVSSPFGGLYYLAEAEGQREFGARIASLPFPPAPEEVAPSLETLRAALAPLEDETIALFERDPAARTAIPVSALLKETRELLDAGRRAGATLVLLQTRLELSRRTPGPEASSSGPSERRDSLGRAFAALADGSDAATDRAVHDAVLPLHASLARTHR